MVINKIVDIAQLETDLTTVANAIRAKSGGNSQLTFPSGFVSEIGSIVAGGGGIPGVYLFHGGADPVDVPDGFVMPSGEVFNPTQIGDPVVFAMLLYCDADFVDDMMGDEFTTRLGPLYFARQSGVEYIFETDTQQCVFSISGGKITFLSGKRSDYDHIEIDGNLDWMMLVIDMRDQAT